MERDFHAGLLETSEGFIVLDWLVRAYDELDTDIQFVGGFKVSEIEERFNQFRFQINPNWKETGATGSLFCADLPNTSELFVSYSDILYRRDLVKRLSQSKADIAVAVDSSWKDRYRGRSKEDLDSSEKVNLVDQLITRLGPDIDSQFAQAEFIGLVRFNATSAKALNAAKALNHVNLSQSKLSTFVEYLRASGLSIEAIDVQGDWAEMNDPRDLAHFILGTKAQTLDRLSSLVQKSTILDQYAFAVEHWMANQDAVLKGIEEAFNGKRIVIRSSALSEDGFATANAGAYDSVLNIDCDDRSAVRAGCEQVIASYPDKDPRNQVLVQPMVEQVKMSGVAFTRTLNHGSPYYVLNYDQSGSTDAITSGVSREHKTFILRKDKLAELNHVPAELINLCQALREIELFVNYDSLDIEFAINSDNEVYILQVRPIAVDHSAWDTSDADLIEFVTEAEERFIRHNQTTPVALGDSAIFGVMPDWNPAEIIGTNPGRLAISLYKNIIMNTVWSTQRAQYGYRDVRPVPLLETFAGHPYVDVRASFNSFVPNSLSEDLAKRLIDFNLNYLKNHPELHDKVEFEVVPTCFDLNFAKWKQRYESSQFSSKDIDDLRSGLIQITQHAIGQNDQYLSQIDVLDRKFNEVIDAELHPIRKADYLLRDVTEYGTLPFAHLARSAFVAVSFLKSAVATQVIDQAAMDDFLNSIQTVSHQFTRDIERLATENLSMEEFLSVYGHIRPGTYDINSPDYADDPNYYIKPILDNISKESIQTNHESGHKWKASRSQFTDALRSAGINVDEEEVEQFMRGAIEGREYAKFMFTRNLSAAINCLVDFGERIGITRDQLANLTWEELYAAADLGMIESELRTQLINRAAEGERWKRLGSVVELPPLLTASSDFWWFFYPETQANFIGSEFITSEAIDLSEQSSEDLQLEGKIVLIPRADPGYEWLFGRKIAGLITMYGGANSHMAIRAAEFNLPAAIGIGETEYKRIASATVLSLNAGNRKIDIIQ